MNTYKSSKKQLLLGQRVLAVLGTIGVMIPTLEISPVSAQSSIFIPPAQKTVPAASLGKSSRGSLFKPRKGQGVVNEATGGGSRSLSLFVPPAARPIASDNVGGNSRGLFRPKRGRGVVRESTAGGSRNADAILALLPQTFSGLTISARPTFWIYLPASSAKTAIFSLQDEQGQQEYQMTLSIEGKSGVIPITLPAGSPELQVGKNYQWVLAVAMNDELTPKAPYVDGWIQRVPTPPEMTTALTKTQGVQRAEIFGRNGIWYDCLDELAQLRRDQPSNQLAQQEWQNLLAAVDLLPIATVPLGQ
ncbi:DUF928 domain-containing protein [Alkalinema sp. FACHB-956]|uniref:DUF928 domain-containing protein n=1 Tax=Alkalinema sp. FACHB-956 TaxID=2692768 RepID=UPI001682FF7A|nr:DUF928 domain-containing protein [Alkalinema sp. FACHB-956]MBD2329150.1 DUF928 domain-containing protein [Alkalinema sp. FACHB-956]